MRNAFVILAAACLSGATWAQDGPYIDRSAATNPGRFAGARASGFVLGTNYKDSARLRAAAYEPLGVTRALIMSQHSISPGGDEPRWTTPDLTRKWLIERCPRDWDGPLCLDWEHGNFEVLRAGPDDPRWQGVIDEMIALVRFCREHAPDAQVGFYGLPRKEYWRQDDEWYETQRALAPLFAECTALFPSIYKFYEGQEERDREKYGRIVSLALELAGDKPVYLYVHHRYHNSNKSGFKRIAEADFITHIRNAMNVEVDGRRPTGIILWGADQIHARNAYRRNDDGTWVHGDERYQRIRDAFDIERPHGQTWEEYFNRLHLHTYHWASIALAEAAGVEPPVRRANGPRRIVQAERVPDSAPRRPAPRQPVAPPEQSTITVASWDELGRALRSNSTVVLAGDSYARKPITLDAPLRNVTLRFEGKVTWTGDDTMHGVIQFRAGVEDLTIDGFHLEMFDPSRRVTAIHGRVDDRTERGMHPLNITVRNCKTYGASHGVLVESGAAGRLVIEDNVFEDCEKYGIFAHRRIENLQLSGNRITIDPDHGIEHGVRLYALYGSTLIEGNEIENFARHVNGNGVTFQKSTMWMLESPGHGALVKDNIFRGGVVQFGGGGDAGAKKPVRNVVFQGNRIEHELVGTALQLSGGIFGAMIVDNEITTERDVWMYLSGWDDPEGRARTPCETVRWRDNTMNGTLQVGWDGIKAQPKENLVDCAPLEPALATESP